MVDDAYDGVLTQATHGVLVVTVVIFAVDCMELWIVFVFVDVEYGTFDCVIPLEDSMVSGMVERLVDSVESVVVGVVYDGVLVIIVSFVNCVLTAVDAVVVGVVLVVDGVNAKSVVFVVFNVMDDTVFVDAVVSEVHGVVRVSIRVVHSVISVVAVGIGVADDFVSWVVSGVVSGVVYISISNVDGAVSMVLVVVAVAVGVVPMAVGVVGGVVVLFIDVVDVVLLDAAVIISLVTLDIWTVVVETNPVLSTPVFGPGPPQPLFLLLLPSVLHGAFLLILFGNASLLVLRPIDVSRKVKFVLLLEPFLKSLSEIAAVV